MKLYSLREPVNLDCAGVALVGDMGYVRCEVCNYYTDYPRPDKRTVEWMEGSSQICSFVWTSRLIGEVLVTGEVRETLRDSGAEFLPVEFYQDPELGKSKRITKHTKPRVWLPYEGPPLYDLWVGTWVHADITRSSLQLIQVCPECGHKAYEVEGVEGLEHRWDVMKGELVEVHIPRVEGKGIYVDWGDLQGADIFRLHELPGQILCTGRTKALVEEKRFTNVHFIEMGEVVNWTSDGISP